MYANSRLFMISPDIIHYTVEILQGDEWVAAHAVAVSHEKQCLGQDDYQRHCKDCLQVFL